MTTGSNLLWFHAFSRATLSSIAQVLRIGPSPNPNPDSKTRQREIRLGIGDACVYAYLGTTSDDFGERAVALKQGALVGFVSPFDSGGLIEHIHPVCSWSDDERKLFLQAHTWQSSELPELLMRYPGDAIGPYLQGDCPPEAGPHRCLSVHCSTADIWDLTQNTWQAWTWEGRSSVALRTGDLLVAWTCRPDEYADLLIELPVGLSDEEAEEAEVKDIPDRYHPGGVSMLIESLRELQENDNA